MNFQHDIDERIERLRARWVEFQPILRTHIRSQALLLGERLADATESGADLVRRGLARSFETRIGFAAVLVLASAVIGYQLGGSFGDSVGGSDRDESGGRAVSRSGDSAAEAFDDVLVHAEHAFDLGKPEGVDVAGGELVAQYAPVSIDALPVHDASQPIQGPTSPIAKTGSAPAVERTSLPGDEFTLVTRGEIARGETLSNALRRQGVDASAVRVISTELRKVFDFRRTRAGDSYRLAQASDGRVLDFQYSQGRTESFTLSLKGDRYVAARQSEVLEAHVAKIAGVVEGSFYDAITSLGEQSTLATKFAKILAWDMDFSRHVHPGDEFAILYERLYSKSPDGSSVYVRPGKILAGRYSGRSGEHTVVYYENGDGEGQYFRPDGSTVERAFLAAPLAFSRITSRFTNARRHPILKITRAHPGIDYAAPQGTPIFAVGDGIVDFRGYQGANGNFVRIRHTGGYTSHYAHLSRFANGLRVGDRVKQKQIIGYVGSTGLSTGPHVCFRMKKHGQYVDPLRIGRPAGPTIDYDRIDHFREVRDQRLADLGRGPFVAANEAL